MIVTGCLREAVGAAGFLEPNRLLLQRMQVIGLAPKLLYLNNDRLRL